MWQVPIGVFMRRTPKHRTLLVTGLTAAFLVVTSQLPLRNAVGRFVSEYEATRLLKHKGCVTSTCNPVNNSILN